nr:nucleotide-binding alpha-beta plait domain-containing protein [Tanacetum cinerariifolium]
MVMSGSQRSKDDDVQKISTSVFVTNFPNGYGAKALWNTCKLYGHVVDVFIPDRRTKAGKRFGFVRFIKVLDIDHLINNLCMVWVGRNKIHPNVARFQREPLHKQSNKVNNKGTNNVNHGAKGMTNYYAHVVKGNQVQNVGMEECPNMVVDETCLNHEDFSLCLLGKVKEFASLTNLKVVLDDETKKRFQFNLVTGSWFSQIIQAHNDFVIDERVIWVEVEGVPCWVPDFEEDGEEGHEVNDGSHEDDMHGGVSENFKDVEGESDREEFPETNFEEVPDKSIFKGNSVRQNDVHSEDPFGIYEYIENEHLKSKVVYFTTVQNLQAQVKELQSENEHLKSKVVNCQVCQNLQAQVKELQSENEHLKSKVVDCQMCQNLQAQVKELQSENEHLKSKVADCQVCQNLQVQVEELKSVNESFNLSIEELYKVRVIAEATLREIDAMIFAHCEKIRLLEEQSESFYEVYSEFESETVLDTQDNSEKDLILNLQTQVKESELLEKVEQMKSQVSELVEKLQILDQEMKQQIIFFEKDKQMFFAKNEFLEKVSSSVQKEYNDLLASNDVLKQRLETKFKFLKHDHSIERMFGMIEREYESNVSKISITSSTTET